MINPFENTETEHQANEFGLWIFLITEIFFFGVLFVAFALYRNFFAEGFFLGAEHLSVTLGTVNTTILLTSSFTMALALHRVEKGRSPVAFLALSIFMAVAFLGVKAVEYSREIGEGLFPNQNFRWNEADGPHAKLFFFLYFVMTAFHALHILAGIIAIGVVTFKNATNRYKPDQAVLSVKLTALYWHFVDVVWVFLFPVLYLLRRHP